MMEIGYDERTALASLSGTFDSVAWLVPWPYWLALGLMESVAPVVLMLLEFIFAIDYCCL